VGWGDSNNYLINDNRVHEYETVRLNHFIQFLLKIDKQHLILWNYFENHNIHWNTNE